jgi:RNA polymerase sigma-70 factor (ECF subfamily)
MFASVAAVEGPVPGMLWKTWSFTVDMLAHGETHGEIALAAESPEGTGRHEVEPHVLRRAQRGDRDAFVELMGSYDRRLRSLAYRLLDDREATVDAMQDVYVKAFRALPAFEGRSSVGTWLYRITYTTCLDYIERRRHATRHYDDDDPPSLRLVPDPADEVTLRVDLTAALQSLSSEARAAVLMVDRDGYDYRGTAAALGIPTGTLASRLSAARAALRRALDSGEVQQ